MSNIFYTPSGNPGTGSEMLSSLMRAEFTAISTAFDLMPRITTTGLFDTIFTQTGNYTFTLPTGDGTLATTANVATETARATAVENALTTTIANLGITGTVGVETARATAAEALLAPKASPALTGTPTAPTATPGTNTTQVSTTAFTTAAVLVEATRATAAEGVLTSAVTTETTARTTAVAAEASARTTAVAAEATRATAAEATLSGSIAAIHGRYLGTRVLTGSGTFTATTGTNSVVVEGCGSGGGGGAAAAAGNGVGSGGSAGSYAMASFASLFSDVAYSVGSAVTGVASGDGTAGNQTTFGTAGNQLVIPGGLGGSQGVNLQVAMQGAGPGAAPSVTGVATLLVSSTGTAGGNGLMLSGGGALSQMAGAGAPGPWGGGTRAIVPAGLPNFPGPAGTGPGAGGGGGTGVSSGGASLSGKLLVHEFS